MLIREIIDTTESCPSKNVCEGGGGGENVSENPFRSHTKSLTTLRIG